mgnify:CR=1 FL=1
MFADMSATLLGPVSAPGASPTADRDGPDRAHPPYDLVVVAASLGVHSGAVRRRAVLLSVLLAGGAVAVAGPIAFVALTAPHITRRLAERVRTEAPWAAPYLPHTGPIISGETVEPPSHGAARPQTTTTQKDTPA